MLAALALATIAAPPEPFGLSAGFSSDMVLQMAPAKAAVYGFGLGPVSVKVSGTDGAGDAVLYTVTAITATGTGGGAPSWKAFLRPHPAGGSVAITAKNGRGATVEMQRATFGEVFFCSGQSNMALSTFYTFSADTARAAFSSSNKYSQLRLFQFGGMGMNDTLASYSPNYVSTAQSFTDDPLRGSWYNASEATRTVTTQGRNNAHNRTVFDDFSATCLYFGLELVDALGEGGPPIGLIQSAVGGSTIEVSYRS